MLTRFDIVFAKLLPLGELQRNPPLHTSNVYIYIKVTMHHVRIDLPASTKVKTKGNSNQEPKQKKSHMVIFIYIHHIATSIGSPLLIKSLTTLVISMSTNLNV